MNINYHELTINFRNGVCGSVNRYKWLNINGA